MLKNNVNTLIYTLQKVFLNLEDFLVIMSTSPSIMSTCQKIMSTYHADNDVDLSDNDVNLSDNDVDLSDIKLTSRWLLVALTGYENKILSY